MAQTVVLEMQGNLKVLTVAFGYFKLISPQSQFSSCGLQEVEVEVGSGDSLGPLPLLLKEFYQYICKQ
jgi:hypothetical protein